MSQRRRSNYAPQAASTPYLGVEERRALRSVEHEWHSVREYWYNQYCKQTQKYQKQFKMSENPESNAVERISSEKGVL
jgi:hypothetical protein